MTVAPLIAMKSSQVKSFDAVGRELAIADLTRRLGPRSARMTTKALKRDLAALERD